MVYCATVRVDARIGSTKDLNIYQIHKISIFYPKGLVTLTKTAIFAPQKQGGIAQLVRASDS